MVFYYFFIDKMSQYRIRQHRLYSQTARRFCFIDKGSFGLAANTLFRFCVCFFHFIRKGDLYFLLRVILFFASKTLSVSS